MKRKGRLIVLEGIDGSGKSTQIKMMFKYLNGRRIPYKSISFPRYKRFYGALAGRVLRGDFGSNDLSPYLTSLPFAMDRWQARDEIVGWLKKGYLVIADRYVTSSLVHQAAKFKGKRQLEALKWIEEMEYGQNRLPKEEVVILLDMPVEKSQALMKERKKRVYVRGTDVLEKDVDNQKRASKLYKQLAVQKHWQVVKTVNQKGELLPVGRIHKEIVKRLGI